MIFFMIVSKLLFQLFEEIIFFDENKIVVMGGFDVSQNSHRINVIDMFGYLFASHQLSFAQ